MTKPLRQCIRSFEFRSSDPESGDDGRTLSGYAATFNDPTTINSWEGHFNERISPGAFRKTLDENPHVVMQYDHGRDSRVGAIPIGHYTSLKEDSKGLAVEGRLFDNPVVEPVRQAIEAGAINGMSFRFQVVRDAWTTKDGNPIPGNELEQYLWGRKRSEGPLNRDIKEVKLLECGPVTFPAYGTTSVGVRSGEPEGIDPADRQALIEEYMRTAIDPQGTEQPSPTFAELVAADEEGRAASLAYTDALREIGLPDDYVNGIMYRGDDPKKPYGDVDYADKGYQKDGKYRYPLDTKEHVQAAWDYINVQKNSGKYSADDLAKVKSAIKAAAKKFGIDIADDNDSDDESKSSETSGAESATLPTEAATEDAARSGTSSESTNTKRVIPAMPRRIPA